MQEARKEDFALGVWCGLIDRAGLMSETGTARIKGYLFCSQLFSALCYIALGRVLVLAWVMLIRARLYKSLLNENPYSLSIPLDYTT